SWAVPDRRRCAPGCRPPRARDGRGWPARAPGPAPDHLLQMVPYMEYIPCMEYGKASGARHPGHGQGRRAEFGVQEALDQALLQTLAGGVVPQVDQFVGIGDEVV